MKSLFLNFKRKKILLGALMVSLISLCVPRIWQVSAVEREPSDFKMFPSKDSYSV